MLFFLLADAQHAAVSFHRAEKRERPSSHAQAHASLQPPDVFCREDEKGARSPRYSSGSGRRPNSPKCGLRGGRYRLSIGEQPARGIAEIENRAPLVEANDVEEIL